MIFVGTKSEICRVTEREKAIAGAVPAIEKARLYRGKGGEIMRSAVSRLIEFTSKVRVRLPVKSQNTLHDSLNENLKHPNSDIQVSLFLRIDYQALWIVVCQRMKFISAEIRFGNLSKPSVGPISLVLLSIFHGQCP